jgi:DNA-binding SARP family transcriptional activator
VEHAQTEALVGSDEAARRLIAQGSADLELPWGHLLALVRGLLSIRNCEPGEALVQIAAVDPDVPSTNPGFKSAITTVSAIAQLIMGGAEAREAIERALEVSSRQGAGLWHAVARLAMAALDRNLDNEISSVPEELLPTISMAAEVIAPRLHELGPDSWTIVASEATRFKERWRAAIRREIPGSTQESLHAARLLDLVGDETDIAPLRRLARLSRVSPADKMLGRRLARALAAPVEVHDLGRVAIRVGESEISGDQVRRKVLALLSYLLTKPRWAGTREEVTEALWPDMSPGAAINSLNQTVYFLRRVFEPTYSEETTAGYLHQDSDLLWLDEQLISARSRMCLGLIDGFTRASDAADAVELADLYTGRFALDFAYEDWSSDFREWLHVGYLNVVETQVRADIDSGEFQRGISIARRALEVEPRNEELELSLLRLLRRAGAHSAAAEQYARYANVLRSELGIEPPAPESL